MRLLACSALTAFTLASPSLAQTPVNGRQMDCTYEQITHMTTMQITENDTASRDLDVTFYNELSPIGGQEVYLFAVSPTEPSRQENYFQFLHERLYYSDDGYFDAVVLVDFERAVLKELQYPAAAIEDAKDTISSPVVIWECQRTN